MNNTISTPHHRFFTVEKANSSLILVRPIVTELLTKHKRLAKVQQEIEVLEERQSHQTESDEATTLDQELDELYSELQALLDQISHNVDELHLIGCIFKDFQVGIVDFPTQYQGRAVYLCWQHGESEITHWHEMEEGYNGRNSITDYFTKNSTDVHIGVY